MSDPASTAVSPLEAACSEGVLAASFEAEEAALDALSRAGVVLVVTAIVIILQNRIPDCVTR